MITLGQQSASEGRRRARVRAQELGYADSRAAVRALLLRGKRSGEIAALLGIDSTAVSHMRRVLAQAPEPVAEPGLPLLEVLADPDPQNLRLQCETCPLAEACRNAVNARQRALCEWGDVVSEHIEQAALMEWAARTEGRWPELALLHAIPNGGFRAKATAVKLKAEGVKPGVPDVFLPVARGGYHGFYIEMKWGDNKPSPEQLRWHADLRREGYLVRVCYSWVNAAQTLERYLEGALRAGGEYEIG